MIAKQLIPMLLRRRQPTLVFEGSTYVPVLGPYRIAAREIYATGKTAGQGYATGAAIGELYATGAAAGQVGSHG